MLRKKETAGGIVSDRPRVAFRGAIQQVDHDRPWTLVSANGGDELDRIYIIKMPRLEPFYREHKYCSVDALYGNGHPPDTVVACALAYHAFRIGRAPGDYGIII